MSPERIIAKLQAQLAKDTPEQTVAGMAQLVFMKDQEFAGKEKLYKAMLSAMASALVLKLLQAS